MLADPAFGLLHGLMVSRKISLENILAPVGTNKWEYKFVTGFR